MSVLKFPDQVWTKSIIRIYRFARLWKQYRQADNVEFYQDNGESTHFTDNTFDIVHFAYVLHEMPMENAQNVLAEIYRILKPGGVLSGFEGTQVAFCTFKKIFEFL